VSSLVAEGVSRIETTSRGFGATSTYESDGTTGTGYTSTTTMGYGTSQSDLSKLLTAPEKPSETAPEVSGLLFGTFVFGLMAMFAFAAESGAALTAGVLLGAISAGLFYLGYSRTKRQQKENQTQLPVRLAEWERAMRRWRELYYCRRDHGVFEPAEGRFVPIGEMADYLQQ